MTVGVPRMVAGNSDPSMRRVTEPGPPVTVPRAFNRWAPRLAAAGVDATLEGPDGASLRVGARPERALVRFHTRRAVRALARGDVAALGEAYVEGEVTIDGDLLAVLPVTRVGRGERGLIARLAFLLLLHLPGRRLRNRRAVSFHYDRPTDFFLPWLGRSRSYSHGLYVNPNDDLDAAQERKLDSAAAAVRLRPGMRVLDMGAGWGSFVEFAGRRGVHVHAITVSRVQHDFVADLIRRHDLPCRVELVDFLEFHPTKPFDAAVFLGTLEHVPDYRRVAAFLHRHLTPGGRVWADFCAQNHREPFGTFLRRHVWPGPVAAVTVRVLERALAAYGLVTRTLADDTQSYERTVRDWADRLDAAAPQLSARYGAPAVRTFQLYLRASQYQFRTRLLQAHHLVAEAPARPA